MAGKGRRWRLGALSSWLRSRAAGLKRPRWPVVLAVLLGLGGLAGFASVRWLPGPGAAVLRGVWQRPFPAQPWGLAEGGGTPPGAAPAQQEPASPPAGASAASNPWRSASPSAAAPSNPQPPAGLAAADDARGMPDLMGQLAWPAEGLVVSTSGWRRNPDRGDWSYQPGLELAVGSRAAVRAAADGVVREVRLDDGLYAITLDHGGGWTTHYAGLAAVSVRQGSQVRRGAVLGFGPTLPEPAVPAMSGPDGGPAPAGAARRLWSAGGGPMALIRFEVRRDGESVDPLRAMEPGSFRVADPDPQPAGTYGDFSAQDSRAPSSAVPVPGP